jgi:ribosomal protein S18 acetylase RimI-like enzyme
MRSLVLAKERRMADHGTDEIAPHIETATPEDAGEILALIRRAFAPVGEQYGDPALPPLTETLGAFRERFSDHVVLKAILDGRIVGSVLGVMDGDTCLVGRLVVEPGHQGRGVGRSLAEEIERHFPQAERFELFTGDRSTVTLGLYAALGYRELRRDLVNDRLTLVFLEKRRD